MGYVMMIGGALALLLAPVMVTIKYMTGWAIVPEPFWVASAERALRWWVPHTSPVALWVAFGSLYTAALVSVLAGVIALSRPLRGSARAQHTGYWLMLAGLVLVVPGDAVHTWTWHQHGLTMPTPGTNPVANTAYAVHMMGMNLVLAGSTLLGVTALRQRSLARWLAWPLALLFPSAFLASITMLPTTPSGALWLFSVAMAMCGYQLSHGHSLRPARA